MDKKMPPVTGGIFFLAIGEIWYIIGLSYFQWKKKTGG